MLHFTFDQEIRDPQDPPPPARPDLVYRRLEGQCAGLDVPLEYLALPRNDAGWWAGGKPHRRPEHAALAALTAGRSIGVAMEGTPALTWMHAASRRALTHPDRPWAVGAAPARDAPKIVRAASRASRSYVTRSFRKLRGPLHLKSTHRALTPRFISAFHKAAAPQMVRALEIYLSNPGAYRSGWPDLTVIRGDQLWLYEVKTTDRLNENQLRFLLDIAKPLGLGMTVLRLQPIPTDRQPSRRRWWPF